MGEKEPMKYRKKPVVIEAIQYISQSDDIHLDQAQDRIADFMGKNIEVSGDQIIIPTLEGDHQANVGDWIIRGVKGEFYPCKPDIFEMTYEKVEES